MDHLGGGKADRYASQHRQCQFVVRLHRLILLGLGLRMTHPRSPRKHPRAPSCALISYLARHVEFRLTPACSTLTFQTVGYSLAKKSGTRFFPIANFAGVRWNRHPTSGNVS